VTAPEALTVLQAQREAAARTADAPVAPQRHAAQSRRARAPGHIASRNKGLEPACALLSSISRLIDLANVGAGRHLQSRGTSDGHDRCRPARCLLSHNNAVWRECVTTPKRSRSIRNGKILLTIQDQTHFIRELDNRVGGPQ
jgi:hypothetical protein